MKNVCSIVLSLLVLGSGALRADYPSCCGDDKWRCSSETIVKSEKKIKILDMRLGKIEASLELDPDYPEHLRDDPSAKRWWYIRDAYFTFEMEGKLYEAYYISGMNHEPHESKMLPPFLRKLNIPGQAFLCKNFCPYSKQIYYTFKNLERTHALEIRSHYLIKE